MDNHLDVAKKVESEYFNEIYKMKQAAAKRKLA